MKSHKNRVPHVSLLRRGSSTTEARTRILYYSHTRQVSGGERVLFTMLEVLDRNLYEPLVACPQQGPGDLDKQLRGRGFEPLAAPLLNARFTSNPINLLGYLASTISAIRTFRATILKAAPDLLHANSVRAGLIATLATLGTRTRILWHIHDDLPKHPITTRIRAIAFRSKRSQFVAVSKATAQAFMADKPFAPRMHVLYNSIDPCRFPRKQVSPPSRVPRVAPLRPGFLESPHLDPEAQAFRSSLDLTPQDFLAVTIGMINPRKGQLQLLDTWATLNNPTAHLAIVGAPIFNDDHRYEAKVIARQRELKLDNVRFTGPRKDIPAILRAADLLILNATVEPFGLVLLEAISSGTPVLATRVGGIPEIVDDRRTGLLVTPNSPALAERIAELIANPAYAAQLADRAHTEVLPRFTVELFRTNLHRLYTGLISTQ